MKTNIVQDRDKCIEVVKSIMNGSHMSIPNDLSVILEDRALNMFIPKNLEFIYLSYVLEAILTGNDVNYELLHLKIKSFQSIKDLPNLDEYVTMFLTERDKKIFNMNIDKDNLQDLLDKNMYIIALVNIYYYMNKKFRNIEQRLTYIKELNNIQ